MQLMFNLQKCIQIKLTDDINSINEESNSASGIDGQNDSSSTIDDVDSSGTLCHRRIFTFKFNSVRIEY